MRYGTTLRVLKVAWMSKEGWANSIIARSVGTTVRTVKRDKAFLRRRGFHAIKLAA